jgi:nucleotide-binding universal stress UspA family protein
VIGTYFRENNKMKILIATDGSEYSSRAVEKCCEILVGGRGGPEMRVVSVYEAQVPMASEPFAISADYYKRAEMAADEAREAIMHRCGDGAAELSSQVLFGRPAEMIIEEAGRWGADIIVVGSHGRGFWGRLTLGSVSDAVMHHAPCSVLVVRGEAGS